MSNTIGSTRILDTSRKEALQGLLSSLSQACDDPSSDKPSAEQVRKLSEKINEILGDSGPSQDDQLSQLPNEDGLPIIDISEPVNEDSEVNTSSSFVPEPEFIPLSLLQPDERERRRRESDRILDLLEEEERLQQLREERNAEEERKEAIRKRKESAKAELKQLKAARDLQKKMGRAFVRNAKGVVESEHWQEEETCSKVLSLSPVAKKSVSFADGPMDQQTSTRQPDWGDVTPGRLRAEKRIPLVSAAETQKYPVKMQVVERRSAATPAFPSHNHAADSDDESPSTESLIPRLGHCSSDHSSGEEKPLSSSDLLDEESLEEFDYDAAQHHREIALEYHKKRHTISSDTAKALAVHALDDYQQQETHQSNGQAPLSRFRADRMASAYDKSHVSVSTPIEQNIIPISRIKSLQNSVKLGNFENDQLVGGGSGESGSEDETIRDVIQMLQMGSIQNVGSDFKRPPMSTIAPPQNSDVMQSTTGGTSGGVKPSRFKLAHREGTIERANVQDNDKDNIRTQPTITRVVERKDPGASPSQRFPVNKPPPRSSTGALEVVPPMIIDPPSFPMTAGSLSPQQAVPSVEKPISRFILKKKK